MNISPYFPWLITVLTILSLTLSPTVKAETEKYTWPRTFAPASITTTQARILSVFEDELIVAKIHGLSQSSGIEMVGRWDGQQWRPMGNLGESLEVQVFGQYQGKLIAGGTPLGSGPGSGALARWDGENWNCFGSNIEGSVSALVQWHDLLIVAGKFQFQGLPKVRNLIAWDGESWIPFPVSGLGGGHNELKTLAVHNGDLVVGGTFTEVNGIPTANIAIFDGENWQGLEGGTDGKVTQILSFDGALFAAGKFKHAGGKPLLVLAQWTGAQWEGVGGAFTLPIKKGRGPWISALKRKGNRLFIAGAFGDLGGVLASGVGVWDGSKWLAVAAPFSMKPDILPDLDWEHFTRTQLDSLENIHALSEEDMELFKSSFGPYFRGFVDDFEFFRDQLVVIGPRNEVSPASSNSGLRSSLITWVADRWQYLDWDGNGITRSLGKITLYQNELIIANRLGFRSKPLLEVWRNERWQPLADIPDTVFFEETYVWEMEVSGADLYFVGRGKSKDKKAPLSVFHFDGHQMERLGESIWVKDARTKLASLNGEIFWIVSSGYGSCYKAEGHVLRWHKGAWVKDDKAPKIPILFDVVAHNNDLFMASMDCSNYTFETKSTPVIWRLHKGEWKVVWSHDSGKVPLFHTDGDHLWAAVSGADLNDRTPPPLLIWDGQKWHSKGTVLVLSAHSSVSASVQAMTVFKGIPILMCTSQNMNTAFAPTKDPLDAGLLFFEDGHWRKSSALDKKVYGLLAQGNRLWIAPSNSKNEDFLPVSWFEGDLKLDQVIPSNQLELWYGFASDRDQWKHRRSKRGKWQSLDLDISYPGTPEVTPTKLDRIIRHGPVQPSLGWAGHTRKGESTNNQSGTQVVSPKLDGFFQIFDELSLRFLPKEDMNIRVTFDFKISKNGNPRGRMPSELPRVGLQQYIPSRRDSDRAGFLLDHSRMPPFESGFHPVSLMINAQADSGIVDFYIKAKKLDPGLSLTIRNLRVQKTHETLLDVYDELEALIAGQYRNLDGNKIPLEKMPLKTRAKAVLAFTNQDFTRLAGNLFGFLRYQGLMDSPSWASHEDFKIRAAIFKHHQEQIDEQLLSSRENPYFSGWLPNNTFYIRAPRIDDVHQLLDKKNNEFSLRTLGPESNLILDLRRYPKNWTTYSGCGDRQPKSSWRKALLLASMLVDQPTTVFSYRGVDYFLQDPMLADFVNGDLGDPAMVHLIVEPVNSWSPRGEIAVLINEWSYGLTVMALKGRPGITVVGSTARNILRPKRSFNLANGKIVDIASGLYLSPSGENILMDGVVPDLPVPFNETLDLTFEKALEMLAD